MLDRDSVSMCFLCNLISKDLANEEVESFAADEDHDWSVKFLLGIYFHARRTGDDQREKGQSVHMCKSDLTAVGGNTEVRACQGRCESSMQEPSLT